MPRAALTLPSIYPPTHAPTNPSSRAPEGNQPHVGALEDPLRSSGPDALASDVGPIIAGPPLRKETTKILHFNILPIHTRKKRQPEEKEGGIKIK